MKSTKKYGIKWLVGVVLPLTMLVSCSQEHNVDYLPLGMTEHTVVMYLNANNNLQTFILNNAYDAEEAMLGVMQSKRLLIYLDLPNSTKLYEVRYLPYGTDQFIKRSILLKEYPDQISTTPEVMSQVMEDIALLAPSKSYGLIHAGHGSGWFPKPSSGVTYDKQKSVGSGTGVGELPEGYTVGDEYDFGAMFADNPLTRFMGYDGSTSQDASYTNSQEFVEGISPLRFDYIVFDACFMSSVEFLYDLQYVTDYVLASPVEVWGPGFPYKDIIGLLAPGKENLTKVCEKIVEVYRTDIVFTSNTPSCALALIDCSKMELLADAMKQVYNSAKGRVSNAEIVEPQDVIIDILADSTSVEAEQHFDIISSQVQVLDRMRPAGFYDLEDFALALSDSDRVAYENFCNALAEVVVCSESTDNVKSYGVAFNDSDWTRSRSLNYDYITPKDGGSKLDLCGVNCYIPRSNAPLTSSYYFQTKWARKVFGL